MTNFRLLLAFLIVSPAYQAHSAENILNWASIAACKKQASQRISLALFGDKTNVPSEVKATLDTHPEELQILRDKFTQSLTKVHKCCVAQMPWLDGYFIKHGIERPRNAEMLQEYIDKNQLTNIRVAKKYWYHLPGRPFWPSNSNYLVFAKKAPGSHIRQWSLPDETQQQLTKLEKIHHDLHSDNYVFDQEKNTVTIIDTDCAAMITSGEMIDRIRMHHSTYLEKWV